MLWCGMLYADINIILRDILRGKYIKLYDTLYHFIYGAKERKYNARRLSMIDKSSAMEKVCALPTDQIL